MIKASSELAETFQRFRTPGTPNALRAPQRPESLKCLCEPPRCARFCRCIYKASQENHQKSMHFSNFYIGSYGVVDTSKLMHTELPKMKQDAKDFSGCRCIILRPPGILDYNAISRGAISACLCPNPPSHKAFPCLLESSEVSRDNLEIPCERGVRSTLGTPAHGISKMFLLTQSLPFSSWVLLEIFYILKYPSIERVHYI